jgi:hypothetical protein
VGRHGFAGPGEAEQAAGEREGRARLGRWRVLGRAREERKEAARAAVFVFSFFLFFFPKI